jgi:GT2 family glycosyltransferase
MLPEVPDDGRIWICHTFVGTAFAVRRDLFLRLGGFQGALFHWGEEAEYSQRLLAAGYVVGLGSRGMILHQPAGVAAHSHRVNRYVYRAGMLTLWLGAPTIVLMPLLIGQVARYVLRGVLHPRQLPAILEGCAMGLKAIAQSWHLRKPVSVPTYCLWLRLRRELPAILDDIVNLLPDMKHP